MSPIGAAVAQAQAEEATPAAGVRGEVVELVKLAISRADLLFWRIRDCPATEAERHKMQSDLAVIGCALRLCIRAGDLVDLDAILKHAERLSIPSDQKAAVG